MSQESTLKESIREILSRNKSFSLHSSSRQSENQEHGRNQIKLKREDQ